jgi:flavin prenyltransferase
MSNVRRVVVGMSGASGQIYGIRLLQALRNLPEVEIHLVMSRAARITIRAETDWTPRRIEDLAHEVHRPSDIGAAIASGSFATAAMMVVPCSIKTLSAIAHSYSEDLLARAADVHLKEGRPLLLMVRETPLHQGHLQLMLQAAQLGCVIFPPVPAFYSHPQTLDDVVAGTVGRMLSRVGIVNDLYSEWSGMPKSVDVQKDEKGE